MGLVYEALDERRGQTVALKTLQRLSADDILRFKNEFRYLSDLDHSNLVRLGELLCIDERWFLTMEMISGVDFLAHVRPVGLHEPASISPGFGSPSPLTQATALTEDLGSSRSGSSPTRAPPRLSLAERTQLDERRLRAALPQLVDGILALHEAGIVHRDIKPSNVLVEHAGRVVLLDFGLATTRGTRRTTRTAGTPHFMAPEQAAGLPASPPADWYAVGVMLYLALVGQLPFMGEPRYVLKRKRFVDAPAPSDVADGVPPDLDELCVELLRRNPEERPPGAEIIRRLGAVSSAGRSRARRAQRLFVGRRAELRALHASFDSSREAATAVLLGGRSGVGKSALAQHFVRQLARDTAAMVLVGRCYERELVPFKALDEVIDNLTHQLDALPSEVVRAILPEDVRILAQAFPVFHNVVASFAESEAGDTLDTVFIADPQQQRAALFSCLRALFTNLARYRPLVIVIHDLQWADRDSVALIAELTRPPEAPPMMLLAALRPVEHGNALSYQAVARYLACECRQLVIEPLSVSSARELAHALLEGTSVSGGEVAALAQVVAEESLGLPYFVELLCRHLVAQARANRGAVKCLPLDAVLRDQIGALDPAERRMLALVCLSGRPITIDTLTRALVTEFSTLMRLVSRLKRDHFIIATGSAGSDRIECYHDSLRNTTLAALSSEEQRAAHRALAEALELDGVTDIEGIALHWRGAGDLGRAAEYAERAARAASAALAFDRAADLYGMVLEFGGCDDEQRLALLVQRGEALVNAGRGIEAGHTFLEIASRYMGAPEHRVLALDFRQRAVGQLLVSGQLADGNQALQALLGEIGIPYPNSKLQAVMGLIYRRARLRLALRQPITLQRPETTAVTAVDPRLSAIEIAHAASVGLAIFDNLRSAYFQTRALERALVSGDAYRIARSLCMEACLISVGGHRSRARAGDVLERATQLAETLDHPHIDAMVLLAAAVREFMCGRWRETFANLEKTGLILRNHCVGVSWELTTMQRFMCWTLWQLGRIKQQEHLVPLYTAEAEARGDRHAVMSFAANLRLSDDDVTRERRRTLDLLREYSRGVDYIPKSQLMFNLATLELYEGDGVAAWRRLEFSRGSLWASAHQRVETARVAISELWARAAIAAYAHDRQRRQRRHATRALRRLGREPALWARAHRSLLRGCLETITGRDALAVRCFEAAEEQFEGADMALLAHLARDRRGALIGGSEGHELRAHAHQYLTEQGITNPARYADMLAPGDWAPFAGRDRYPSAM